jgi:hypothetical protein
MDDKAFIMKEDYLAWFLILEEGRDCSQVGARVNSGEG